MSAGAEDNLVDATTVSVADSLAAVHTRIASACSDAGRAPTDVQLMAVSKRHPASAIEAAWRAGQRVFGENYVQELCAKADALAELDGLEFRLIGHLQRNKVKHVVRVRAAIDTVDSLRLLEAIGSECARQGVVLPICLQVNVAGERQKSGCDVADLPALVEAARACESVALEGLMTVPPAGDAEDARPHFASLRALAQGHGLKTLSMGMSADLEVAIQEGATCVRVGTAIFGARRS